MAFFLVTKYDGVRAGKGDARDDWRKCGHISLDSDSVLHPVLVLSVPGGVNGGGCSLITGRQECSQDIIFCDWPDTLIMWTEEVTLTEEEQKERFMFRPLQSLDDSDTKTLVNAGLSEGSNDGNIHTEDVTCKIQSSLVAKHSNLEHFLFPFQWSSEGGIVGPDQLVVLDEV